MMRLRFACGWAVLLLVAACDKQQDRERSGAASAPEGSTRKQVRDTRSSREETTEEPEDPRIALETARRIEDPAARDKALAAVAWNAIELDPELAGDAFEALSPDGPDRLRLIQHFAMRRAEQNPAAALEWAESLGSEKEIAAAKCQIALVLAEAEPERAANLLSEAGLDGRELEVAVVQVLQRWAAKAPAGAAAWVTTFPDGQARDAGIRAVVAPWMKVDARAALGWMSSLTDKAVRKETALAMAETLLQQPEPVREQWLAHADATLRGEIDGQHERAMANVGDNVPQPAK